MGDTKIEWTRNADGAAGKTWTPIQARNEATGKVGWFCEHVSEGCRNCYAERMNSNTYFGNGLDYKSAALDQVELFLNEKILEQPLHWRKPVNIFPCSMTDLFGRWVKDEWLDRIFQVMYDAKRHTFQCLTKRPERMLDYVSRSAYLSNAPLENVWLGVSVEDQKTADERIPLLMETPAAVRWISAEPLLGLIDLESVPTMEGSIDWVVVGGESGPKARPMHPDWARSLRDQCVAAGVPFFFKQWGEWSPFATEAHYDADSLMPGNAEVWGGDCGGPHSYGAPWKRSPDRRDLSTTEIDGKKRFVEVLHMPDHKWGKDDRLEMIYLRVGKKTAGRLLDGREWNEYPNTSLTVRTGE